MHTSIAIYVLSTNHHDIGKIMILNPSRSAHKEVFGDCEMMICLGPGSWKPSQGSYWLQVLISLTWMLGILLKRSHIIIETHNINLLRADML